jgi:hypothetical protein
VRIDKLSGSPGSLVVGVLLTPFRPAECKADELMTRAWMLSDEGLLFRTGRAGREELQARASLRLPPPEALFLPQGSILVLKRHRPQQGLGSVSFQVYRPGVKYQAHGTPSTQTAGAGASGGQGLSSGGEGGAASQGGKAGREAGAVVAEARIHGIPAGARPFVNLVQQGDRVSLIPVAELRSALKRLRSAHAGQALSVAQMLKDPKLGLKKRKQLLRERREERERLLRREIENDDEKVFNPLQEPVLGVEVDKDLHKDRLFQDDDNSAQDSWNLWNQRSSIDEDEAEDLVKGIRTDLRSRPKKDKRQADKKLEPAHSIAHQVHDMLTREPRRRQRHLRASTADQQVVDHDSSSSFDFTRILWSEEEGEEQGKANKEEAEEEVEEEEEKEEGVVAAEREAQHQGLRPGNESPSASSLSLSAHHGSGQRSAVSVKTVTSGRKKLKQGRDLLKRDRGPAVVKFNLDDDSAQERVVKVQIKASLDDQGSAVPAGAA